MYGLLGWDNIWLRYNYLNIWNLRVQKNLNIEKIAFKVVQYKTSTIPIITSKTITNYVMVSIYIFFLIHRVVKMSK